MGGMAELPLTELTAAITSGSTSSTSADPKVTAFVAALAATQGRVSALSAQFHATVQGTVPNATYTRLDISATGIRNLAGLSVDTSTGDWVQIASTGLYRVSGSYTFSDYSSGDDTYGNVSGARCFFVTKSSTVKTSFDGNNVVLFQVSSAWPEFDAGVSLSGYTHLRTSAVFSCTAGEYLQPWAYQTSGKSLNGYNGVAGGSLTIEQLA